MAESQNVFSKSCLGFHCVGASKREPSTGDRVPQEQRTAGHVSIEQDLCGATCVKNFGNDFIAKLTKHRAKKVLKHCTPALLAMDVNHFVQKLI